MGVFDQVHILPARSCEVSNSGSGSLVVAGAGCKTGDIVGKVMAAGLTVPLGARPSTGAGLWLQGGIGHLAGLHGLSCDAIIGAVVISVHSGQLFCRCRSTEGLYPVKGFDVEHHHLGYIYFLCLILLTSLMSFTMPSFIETLETLETSKTSR